MKKKLLSLWVPILIGTCFIIATLLLFRSLVVQENAHIKRATELRAKSLKAETEKVLESRILSLVRMGKRWEMRGRTPKTEWESDAMNYIHQHRIYQAIEWVDPSFHVRWIVPLEGNEEAQDLNLSFEERRRAALEYARDHKEITVTRTIDLVQGGKGFLVYIPLYPGEKFDGFILGVFRVRQLFDYLVSNADIPDYTIAVFDGDEEIYSQSNSNIPHLDKWCVAAEIPFRNLTWRIQVWPGTELLSKAQPVLPIVTLVVGPLIAILLALSVSLTQMTFLRKKQIELSNQEMRKEIATRKQIEEELRELTESLERRVTERTTELTKTNEALRQEIAGRKRMEDEIKNIAKFPAENPYPVLRLAQDGTILYANSSSTFLLRDWNCEVGQIVADPLYQFVASAFRAGSTKEGVEIKYRDQIYSFTIVPIPGAAYVNLYGVEVTERKRIEAVLRKSEERFRTLVHTAPSVIMCLSPEGRILEFNPEAERVYGCKREEVLGQNYLELFLAGEIREVVAADIKKVMTEKPTRGYENPIRSADGSIKFFLWNADRFIDDKGSPLGVIVIGQDITERKRMEENIKRMAFHDALTSLPNRMLFNDRLTLAVAHAHRKREMLAVLFLDLDGFKGINDTLGHALGDRLLQGIADRLKISMREDDTIARSGGDEFTLLLPGITHAKDVCNIAKKPLRSSNNHG